MQSEFNVKLCACCRGQSLCPHSSCMVHPEKEVRLGPLGKYPNRKFARKEGSIPFVWNIVSTYTEIYWKSIHRSGFSECWNCLYIYKIHEIIQKIDVLHYATDHISAPHRPTNNQQMRPLRFLHLAPVQFCKARPYPPTPPATTVRPSWNAE